MDIESIKQLFLEHLPTIVNYGLTLIAYIVVIIFKTKVNKTRTSMTVLYKDKTKELKEEWSKDIAIARKELAAAKEAETIALKKLEEVTVTYESRLAKLENAIKIYAEGETDGEVVELHSDTGNPESISEDK